MFASRETVLARIHDSRDQRRHHDRAGHYTTLFANGPEFEGLVEETHQMHRVMLEQAVELTALKEMVGRLTGAMEEEKKLPEKEVE